MGAAAAAKLLQSCPTLCDLIDGSPPGSPVPGILQARTLEWVAISFSNVWQWKVKVKSLSHVRLLATPRTAAHQAPPSMGFSRQEYWSGVPLPSPWALLLAGKLFLVPLSSSNLHILWSGATDNSLLHQTGSSILGFWFLEERKEYNISWLSHPETTNLTLRWMAHNWSLPSALTVCLKLMFVCLF